MLDVRSVELDAVPTSEIAVRSVDESIAWLQYSLFVLQPRSKTLERAARALMFNPLRYFAWRRAQRAWEANTERMEAILDANDRWARSCWARSYLP